MKSVDNVLAAYQERAQTIERALGNAVREGFRGYLRVVDLPPEYRPDSIELRWTIERVPSLDHGDGTYFDVGSFLDRIDRTKA